MKVKALDYHRNGVGGYGFHVGIIEEDDKEMLVIRFGKEADKKAGGILCAAFDLAQLDKREIRFFHNSFRGDYFSETMDLAIEKEEKENVSNH